MIHLGKGQLIIGCLGALLGILLLLPEPEIKGAEALPTEQSEVSYPGLFAPSREIVPTGEGEKVCYLTFDDGPSKNTEKVLDILEQYHGKATFFVIGESITPETAPILERMQREGHAVGMHANVHSYEKLYESRESFLGDYEKLYNKLKEQCGIETALFRFPGGSVCSCLRGRGKEYREEMEERGFSCFDWKSSGEDSVGHPTVSSICDNVFSTGLRYDTTIVLLHDSAMADKTVEALPEIMDRFLKEGYRFESLLHAKSYVFPDSR